MDFLDVFKKDPVISNMVNVQLALNLLFEVFEGKDSKYWHYLKTLPAHPKTALSCDLADIQALKGSRYVEKKIQISVSLVVIFKSKKTHLLRFKL